VDPAVGDFVGVEFASMLPACSSSLGDAFGKNDARMIGRLSVVSPWYLMAIVISSSPGLVSTQHER